MERGGATYRLVTNHLGSVELVVHATSGQVVAWRDYDEWGRVVADSNPDFQPFGFGGGLLDSELGLLRLGAREYDPAAGRFLSKDGLVFAAGQANLYTYAADDPVNLSDPSGNTIWSALGGALLGGIVNATYVASRTGASWQDAALAFAVGAGGGFVGGLIPIPGVSGAVSGAITRFGNHLLVDNQLGTFCRTGFGDAQLQRELVMAAFAGGVFGGVGRLAGEGLAGLQPALSSFVAPLSETATSILGADLAVPLIQQLFPGRGGP